MGCLIFFLIEKNKPTSIEEIMEQWNQQNETNTGIGEVEVSIPYKHILSHQIIVTKFILIDRTRLNEAFAKEPMQPYSLKKVSELPKPVLISRFLNDYQLL